MLSFTLGLIIGLFVGAIIGFIITACLARTTINYYERELRHRKEDKDE